MLFRSVRDSWKCNHDNIVRLRMKRTHSAVLVLGKGEFDVRVVIRWSEPYYKNDIQVRLYLGDDVVGDFFCAYDRNIFVQAYRQAAPPFVVNKQYQVDDVNSVDEFLENYYKRDRFTDSLVDTYKERLQKEGYCSICHHDSKTGKVVSYYA